MFKAIRDKKLRRSALGAGLVVVAGILLWHFSIGLPWSRVSYDYLFRFGSGTVSNNVVLLQLDSEAYDHFRQTRGQPWDRRLHTKLLNRLADDRGDTFARKIHPVPALPDDEAGSSWFDPRDLIGRLWRASLAVTDAAVRAGEGIVEIGSALMRPAQPTELSGHITGMRRYAAVSVPLRDVRKVCKSYDVTVNDVALAAITASYRAALIRRGERPQSRSLRTLVPVSLRSGSALDNFGNNVSLLLPYLPVEESDPVKQLRTVQRRLTAAKRSGQRQAGGLVVAATNVVPFPLTAWAIQAMARLPQRAVVTVATNVPGPAERLQVMGRPVVRLLPILPIALRVRTGVAILSYADDLTFGITADYDAASDVNELAQGIVGAVRQLAASAAALRSPRDGARLPGPRSARR